MKLIICLKLFLLNYKMISSIDSDMYIKKKVLSILVRLIIL